ncbi:hypothetical protein JOQ06_028629, partial [Pogonophryne albipinna]
MSGTPQRQTLGLLLQEKRGRCDMSRDDFLFPGKHSPVVPPLPAAICPYVLGSPVNIMPPMIQGIASLMVKSNGCLSCLMVIGGDTLCSKVSAILFLLRFFCRPPLGPL